VEAALPVSSVDFLADLGTTANAQALARLLSVAAAPPWPHELRGYESARRAFENAGATPVRHSIGVPLRTLIGVKLVAVAGALTVTGVAFAAEADVLPSPIQRAAHQMLGGVGVPDPDPRSRPGPATASSSTSSAQPGTMSASGSPGGDHVTGTGAGPGTPTGTASGPDQSTSAADAVALCRAYAAQQAGQEGALSGHDRHRLVTLAGGEDKVDGFCAGVLAAPSSLVPQPTGGPVPTPVSPDSSRGHEPQGSTGSPNSTPSTSGSVDGNGHSHTPSPSHPSH
jgi:hypothetical protein